LKTNTIRVITGKYKNRRLKFPSIDGLRPTSDQLKETIFNWLAPYIHGSTCIDAFAGSGSLGIESLSRGATKAIFYELNAKAINYIKENLQLLGIPNCEIYKKDCIKALASIKVVNSEMIIFLDPPFNKNLANPCLQAIVNNTNIPSGTIIYIETEKPAELDLTSYEVLKEKSTSTISAKLITKT
jgi:16S rRNA (guanine966-N2)-methyltransferase